MRLSDFLESRMYDPQRQIILQRGGNYKMLADRKHLDIYLKARWSEVSQQAIASAQGAIKRRAQKTSDS